MMMSRRELCVVLFLLLKLISNASAWSLKNSSDVLKIKSGYKQRLAADSTFPKKCVTELLLAAGTQLTAEWNRRGTIGLKKEIDFVVAGVLTACYGKFYSMWRVAPTESTRDANEPTSGAQVFGISVPTNAFQSTLDGKIVPTLEQRLLSLVAPVPALFRAGCIASLVGYGSTAWLVALRTWLVPTYVAATANVNVLYALLYTGVFMASVSNLRYQVLQGLVEPKVVDRFLKEYPLLHATTVFAVRLANGLIGSTLAIAGMKALGLQQLKS